MSSRDAADLTPAARQAWEAARKEFLARHPTFAQPFLTCTYRSITEQNSLYEQGRTKPGKIVTNARGGQSHHNHLPSPAFDIAFKSPNGAIHWEVILFHLFSVIAKAHGLSWGGDWKTFQDLPHFEK